MPSNLTLTTAENCPARVNALDAANNAVDPLPVGAVISYQSNDETVASIVIDSTEQRNSLIVTNGPGNTVLVASYSEAAGGPALFTDTIALTVVPVAPVVASIQYVAGTPVPKA